MLICSNCGTEMGEDSRFCPHCGISVDSILEREETRRFSNESLAEEGTLPLSPDQSPADALNTVHFAEGTAPMPEAQRATSPVSQGPTSPPRQDQAHAPPAVYYPQPIHQQYQPPLQPPAPYYQPPPPGRTTVSLGDWLSQGWKLYTEHGLLMSFASFLAALISPITLFILAGPLLMGLYRMAFKTMRGEQPEMNDLFNWEGRFLQAFLAALISGAIYGGLTGAGKGSPFFVAVSFLVMPLLTVLVGLVMPLILDRKIDIAAAVNEVGRLIFSKDALMWWVVGLVFSTIISLSPLACGVGLFIAVPWMVCSSAIAYRQIFGFDDPNRTLS